MGKILLWLQERIKLWTKPATSVLIPGTLSDLTRSRTDLVVENALLRQQLIVLNRHIKRPQLTNLDRFRLVRVTIALYEVLETSHSHRSARYPFALASGIVSQILAEKIAGQAKDFRRNDHADRKDGERESVMESGANTR